MPTTFPQKQRNFGLEEARNIGRQLGIDWDEVPFADKQFRAGLHVEMEHGSRWPETNITNDDPLLAGKIAWAHLKELPDYYTRLFKMERDAKQERGHKEALARRLANVEVATALRVLSSFTHLFHTTSVNGLYEILKTCKLKADPFASFSEVPFTGDIKANEITIAFRRQSLTSQVLKVEYNERWYDKYTEQAAYIAGEGWREQYTQPDECFEYDEETGWEEEDEECLEENYRSAEFTSFSYKSDEREWISRREGKDVKFDLVDIVGLILQKSTKQQHVEKLLTKMNIELPVVVGPRDYRNLWK